MAARANFLPNMLQSLALRTDSLPWRDAAGRLLGLNDFLVPLERFFPLVIGLSCRALRMDSSARIANFTTDRATFLLSTWEQGLRFFISHRRYASCFEGFRLPATGVHVVKSL